VTPAEKLDLAARRVDAIRITIAEARAPGNSASFIEDLDRLDRILALAVLAIDDVRQQWLTSASASDAPQPGAGARLRSASAKGSARE
jgi:hypothetical protein